MTSGLLLFARYAYPPNSLGYCGSEDHAALMGYLREGRTDAGLAELARRFEGAYPYLRLIAGRMGSTTHSTSASWKRTGWATPSWKRSRPRASTIRCASGFDRG